MKGKQLDPYELILQDALRYRALMSIEKADTRIWNHVMWDKHYALGNNVEQVLDKLIEQDVKNSYQDD